MEPRFAFTAKFWGNDAVVCRAVEDRPGPVVEQQFGQFPTWTQANSCASKLNEGLGLDPLDVRQIVTSSFLATACVLQATITSLQPPSSIRAAAQAAQLRFLAGELSLALTFCRSASLVPGPARHRALLNARKALEHSRQFMSLFDGDLHELKAIASRTDALYAALQQVLSQTSLVVAA
jgi:hypothetical protein